MFIIKNCEVGYASFSFTKTDIKAKPGSFSMPDNLKKKHNTKRYYIMEKKTEMSRDICIFFKYPQVISAMRDVEIF